MTRSGIATTLDREVIGSLTGPVTVHSVFASAANLETRGGLFTLTAASRPAGPRTAVTDLATLAGLGLEAGQHGELSNESLVVGGLHLDLSPATPWQPAAPTGPLRRQAVEELARALNARRLGDGADPGPDSPFEAAVSAALEARTQRFVDAVRDGRADDATAAATSLLGLGQGMTPSGDDWLAGFAFVAAHFPDRLETALIAVREAARQGSTVDVSLAILDNALAGRATDPLHHLLAALTGPPGPDIVAALARLAEIGHSSGIDMTLGLLAAAHIITTHPQGAQ